jgi:hypothetical protein
MSFVWLCTRLLPLLLGARMSCHFFCFYKILLSMLSHVRMTCNSCCCCKISLLLPLTIVNFLMLLLTQECYKLLITPLKCCYHCCHVQECYNLKSIFMWSSCIRVTSGINKLPPSYLPKNLYVS